MKKLFSVLLLVVLPQLAVAQTVLFQAILTGSQENPPVATPAVGFATALYDPATNTLAFSETWSGLLSPTVDAHIHRAPMGVNGPIVLPFPGFPLGVTAGSYSNTFALTPALVSDLFSGLLYANIHTAQFRGGEIRGQLFQPGAVPEPSTYAMAGAALLGLIIARRFLAKRLSAAS